MTDAKVFYHRPPDIGFIRSEHERLRKLKQSLPEGTPSSPTSGGSWLQNQAKGIEAQKEKKRALAYAATEARHAIQGPAPDEVVQQRIALCKACPGRVDVFHGVSDDGGVGFCTKCGCPASQRSKLSVKLTLAGVACPLGKFGKVQGTGGSVKTAVQAVKGMAQTLGAIVKQAVTGDGTEDAKP